MTPLATPIPTPGLAAADPQLRPHRSGTEPAVAPPALGKAAVTAVAPGRALRLDPLEPPQDPPPVKGLGIPPLNTQRVGDFDKVDDPPPAGGDIRTRLSDLEDRPQPAVDLRR